MLNVVIIGSTLNVVISVICVNLTLITVVIASIYTELCEVRCAKCISYNVILLMTYFTAGLAYQT